MMDASGVQLLAAGLSALTAIVNVVLLFTKRVTDPAALSVIESQNKQLSKANKRTVQSLDLLSERLRDRLVALEAKLDSASK